MGIFSRGIDTGASTSEYSVLRLAYNSILAMTSHILLRKGKLHQYA